MYFEHIYERGLAQASYFIGCQKTREAIVIDPKRDIDTYLQIAKRQNFRITHITETHIHADFLSGSRELANATGADIYLSDEGGNDWLYQYEHKGLRDGDIIKIGNIKLQVIHSPGHTPEHISFLLTDTINSDKPVMIFSGDFVFVGEIGRPDLLERAAGIKGTMENGARQMFESLKKFKSLPDYVQVWPGHGAGSACGKSLGAVPSSTVGYEKIVNWALQINNEEDFVQKILDGQPEPPKYFKMMKKMNKTGPVILNEINLPKKLTVEQFKEAFNKNYYIIDTRDKVSFTNEHIAGTINIQDNNSFSNWAGWILKYDEPFILLASDDRIAEINKKLLRIGLDNVFGYFSDIDVLKKNGLKTSSIKTLSVEEMKEKKNDAFVLDVRNKTELDEGFIPGAEHLFVGYVEDNINQIPKEKDIIVYCTSGDRSGIASSILKANGFANVYDYSHGIVGWKKAKQALVLPEKILS
ncbi:MAG TPA: MBL fold metallo-hydrolase [Ignavibacteriaceae bacterium]|nr:MBL fold metallo-hydrolase [Ignavibacteriaceae bacterium]